MILKKISDSLLLDTVDMKIKCCFNKQYLNSIVPIQNRSKINTDLYKN